MQVVQSTVLLRQSVGPDLGPNCKSYQLRTKFAADRQRVKETIRLPLHVSILYSNKFLHKRIVYCDLVGIQ